MVAPVVARKTWRTLEPIHGMIYFAPEADERYAAIGVTGRRMGYFGSRAAAFGPVPAEVVIATFFNFSPDLVRRSIPRAWEVASPSTFLEARLGAADDALRRAFGDQIGSAELAEAADLARRAAEAACERPDGRPLFAAHTALPWPDEPHLVLWHAQTLLREFRGDAHIAALVLEGLSGLDALVTHAASGDVPEKTLRVSRAWSDDAWSAAVDDLRSRGIIAGADELSFTDEGQALRQRVEDRTDAASVHPYAALGDEGCDRLRQLGRPFSHAVIEAGLLAADRAAWSDD